MAKYDDFKLFSNSSDDKSDAFLSNFSNTSIAEEVTVKIDKDTGGWQKSILSQQIVLLSCY